MSGLGNPAYSTTDPRSVIIESLRRLEAISAKLGTGSAYGGVTVLTFVRQQIRDIAVSLNRAENKLDAKTAALDEIEKKLGIGRKKSKCQSVA